MSLYVDSEYMNVGYIEGDAISISSKLDNKYKIRGFVIKKVNFVYKIITIFLNKSLALFYKIGLEIINTLRFARGNF